MKKFLLMLFSAALLFGGGCNDEYDDSALSGRVDDLEGRVEQLEELCNRMNTNIVALRQLVDAFKEADYVTAIIPIVDGGETIGYRISFAKSEPVIVYHGRDGKDGEDGKDGADGKDGKDGYTPVIGVRQDTDGAYYWTLDGEWLTDAAGNKIQANATDGKDGEDGVDGVSPKLKIEEGYWYISYDNGETWTKLDKAAGEDGGDSIFSEVTQDDTNVYFKLQDGTVITLPKSLTSIVEKINSMEFVPRYSDGKVAMVRTAGKSFAEFDFQISPRSVVAEIEKIWESAVTMQAVYTATRAVDFVELPVAEFLADAETGVVTVKVSGEKLSEAFFAGEVEASAVLTVSDSEDSTSSAYVPMIAEDNGGFVASYDSWLGKWKVTSTSSEVNNAPVTFEVTISRKAVGSTYNVSGWGIAYYRDDVVTGYYDQETGAFYLMDGNVYESNSQYYYLHMGRIYDPSDGKYYLWGDDEQVALTATLSSEKNATVVGSEVSDSYGTYTITGLDYFAYRLSDQAYLTFKPAEGYTSGDYPIGPYTMTKTADAPAPPTGELALNVTGYTGDVNGENKDNKVHFVAESTAAVSGLYMAANASSVDAVLAKGYSLDELIEANGNALSQDYLDAMNDGGKIFQYGSVTETLAFICKVVDVNGKSIVQRADAGVEEDDSPLKIDILVENITSDAADITIKPSKGTAPYYFDFYEAEEIAGMTDAEILQMVKEDNRGNIPADYLDQGINTLYNADYFLYNPMDSDTEYTVFAFGFDADSQEATTEVFRKTFKTLPEGGVAPGSLTIDVKIDDTAAPIPGGVTASITPSDANSYYMIDFVLADDIKGMTDAEIIEFVEGKYGYYISWLLYKGDYQTLPTDFGGSLALIPGADYYLVAFGHDGSAATTTTVSKAKFTAGAGPDPAGTTFGFEISDITANGATVTVTASKEPVTYMWDIFSDTMWSQIGGESGVAKYYKEKVFDHYGVVYSPVKIIEQLGAWYSGAEYTYSTLAANAHYRVVAVCVDLQGNLIGSPSVGGEFTTLEAVQGSATAVASFDKYYDGDEVAEAGIYAQAAGTAYIPTTYTVSANAEYYLAGLYGEDLSEYSDDTIIQVMKSQFPAKRTATSMNWMSSWDTNVTFVSVAVDEDGNFGALHRLPAKFVKSGVSPVSDLVANSTASVKSKRPVLCSSMLPELYMPKIFRPIDSGEKLSASKVEARKQLAETHRASAVAAVVAKGSLKKSVTPSLKSIRPYADEVVEPTMSGSAHSLMMLGREESFKKGTIEMR